jgi:hypothetical protein
MASRWLYYASRRDPERCTLWRGLDSDSTLIWRRDRTGGRWSLLPGNGRPERPLEPAR